MIKITDDWFIILDKEQYILAKYQGKQFNPKKGVEEDKYLHEKFFGSIESCLLYIPEFLARRDQPKTLPELEKRIEHWENHILSLYEVETNDA